MDTWSGACLVCGESFFSKAEMAEHVKSHLPGSDVTSPTTSFKQKEPGTNVSPICHCPFCPFEVDNVNEMQSHMTREHTSELATPEKVIPASACIDLTEEGEASGGTADYSCCPLCSRSFHSTEALNQHVSEHFLEEGDEQEQQSNDELLAIRLQQEEKYRKYQASQKAVEQFHFKELKNQHGMGEKYCNGSYRQQAIKNMERTVGRSLSSFGYYKNKLDLLEKLDDGIDDGMTTNTRVTESLKTYLDMTISRGERAWLSSGTDFVGRGHGDSGWGCGYRNIQTILSSLNKNPQYLQRLGKLFHGNIPSIPKIQEFIESAWAQGFDCKGRDQLGGRLVGTRKWIGATEAYTFFASLHLNCGILDFTRPSGPNNTHPLLFDWVYKYFKVATSSSKVVLCDKPPLYLQHDGHSRTIVGVVCKNSSSRGVGHLNSLKLIIFDPGISKFAIWKKDGGRKLSSTSPISRELCTQKFIKPVSSLTNQQYQIVSVDGWASAERCVKQKNVDRMAEKVQ